MVARAVGEGFDCFLFGLCPARLWRLLTLTLAAAKGEQDIPVHRILTMFLLSAPAALLRFSGQKIAFFRFCRAFMRNVQDKPGVKLFSAQPQPHCHQTVANSANGSAVRQRGCAGE